MQISRARATWSGGTPSSTSRTWRMRRVRRRARWRKTPSCRRPLCWRRAIATKSAPTTHHPLCRWAPASSWQPGLRARMRMRPTWPSGQRASAPGAAGARRWRRWRPSAGTAACAGSTFTRRCRARGTNPSGTRCSCGCRMTSCCCSTRRGRNRPSGQAGSCAPRTRATPGAPRRSCRCLSTAPPGTSQSCSPAASSWRARPPRRGAPERSRCGSPGSSIRRTAAAAGSATEAQSPLTAISASQPCGSATT
mmetsp:Transcript_20461/g.51534  ORF Transcript_20461/g.51534 Transcript_20461/m.51534 type:complete len:251 (+) Transcript_20461:470-1222(+)